LKQRQTKNSGHDHLQLGEKNQKKEWKREGAGREERKGNENKDVPLHPKLPWRDAQEGPREGKKISNLE